MHLSAFIHQKSYEHIVHQVRRHPVTLAPAFLGFVVLLALPAVLYVLLESSWPEFFNSLTSRTLLTLLAAVYYLSCTLFFYTYFVTFYLDLLVITNDRLMSIQQHGLFARTISEVDLYKVQDVTSEIKGMFASAFNYGHLLIQTAGSQEVFRIQNVPNPENLRQSILDLAEDDRKYHAGTSGADNLENNGL